MLKPRNKILKILYDDFKPSTKNKIELIKRENLKKGQKISIVSDTMFKAMFFNEKRIKYSAKLISYLLDIDYDILLKNIYFDKNELNKEKEYSKGQRCDYIARIDNTRINIELNGNSTIETMKRNIEYAFNIYASDSKIGESYHHKQLIQININNFSFTGLEDTYYINTIGNEIFTMTNDIIIFQIFIPNIIKKCYTKGEKSLDELERFIMAMAEQDINLAKKYALEDIIMNEYINEAENASFNNGFGESYDHELAKYNEGIEIGRNQGLEQNKRETAITMLKDKLNINAISKYTGLSIKEIEKLQLENKDI